MYLMIGSRPDLCFAITYFGQFQNSYSFAHWNQLKKIVRYLKNTKNLTLKFLKSNRYLKITAFVDADHANNLVDRKSISGYILKLNNNIVCCRSKKQNNVALSSAEAEYYALSDCLTEILFLRQVLSNLTSTNLHESALVYEEPCCLSSSVN